MTIDQISVFIENKTGRLADIACLLGDNNVDLKAMCIADTTEFGILRMITADNDKAVDVLRQAECIFSITPVLAVRIDDKPGSMAKVLRLFEANEIGIEYIYAFNTCSETEAYVVFRVENNQKAEQILTENGYKTISQKELKKM